MDEQLEFVKQLLAEIDDENTEAGGLVDSMTLAMASARLSVLIGDEVRRLRDR